MCYVINVNRCLPLSHFSKNFMSIFVVVCIPYIFTPIFNIIVIHNNSCILSHTFYNSFSLTQIDSFNNINEVYLHKILITLTFEVFHDSFKFHRFYGFPYRFQRSMDSHIDSIGSIITKRVSMSAPAIGYNLVNIVYKHHKICYIYFFIH